MEDGNGMENGDGEWRMGMLVVRRNDDDGRGWDDGMMATTTTRTRQGNTESRVQRIEERREIMGWLGDLGEAACFDSPSSVPT